MHTLPLRRFPRFHVGCLSIVVLLLTVATANSEDALETLAAEYERFGLPFPPANAKPAILKQGGSFVNGEEVFTVVFGLVVEPTDKESLATYWLGCSQGVVEPKRKLTYSLCGTDKSVLAQTNDTELYAWGNEFPQHPDLALAVHCHRRGWRGLAAAFLGRSQESPPAAYRRGQELGKGRVLATLAWNYWCNEFALSTRDRSKIVESLSALAEGPYDLGSAANKNIISDMRATLRRKEARRNSVESILNELTDLGKEKGWRGRGCASLRYSSRRSEPYKKLQAIGPDAVPVLLKHTHDFRMTRCVATDHRGTWHVRIADVVRELLNGWAPEEFAYDFLIREGRGKCVDRAHVLHWWNETQKVETRR